VVKVQWVARIGIAGKLKARGGGDAGTSLTTSNVEIARNIYAPKGFRRRRGICCVGAPRRYARIASSSRLELARNTYARDLLYVHHGLLGGERVGDRI
jgi:hypothetical protein